MGTDIYLYHYQGNPDEWLAKEDEYYKRTDVLWDEFKGIQTLSPEQNEHIYRETRKIADSLGFGGTDDLLSNVRVAIKEPSRKYPKHLFRCGYFRPGIYNRRMRMLFGIDGLYEVFRDAQERNNWLRPDWEAALKCAQEQLTLLENWSQGPCLCVESEIISPIGSAKRAITDQREALEAAHKEFRDYQENLNRYQTENPQDPELKGDRVPSGAYSNRIGDYHFRPPMKVVGINHGTYDYLGEIRPCVYVIYEDTERGEWYRQACEIVVETIEWVLSQPDVDNYRLYRSG